MTRLPRQDLQTRRLLLQLRIRGAAGRRSEAQQDRRTPGSRTGNWRHGLKAGHSHLPQGPA